MRYAGDLLYLPQPSRRTGRVVFCSVQGGKEPDRVECERRFLYYAGVYGYYLAKIKPIGRKISVNRRKICQKIIDKFLFLCYSIKAVSESGSVRLWLRDIVRRCATLDMVLNLTIKYADVAKLADAHDSGSCGKPCRFKSCHPHQV